MEVIPFSQHPAANVDAKTALGTHGVTLHGRQGGVGVDCHPHHPPQHRLCSSIQSRIYNGPSSQLQCLLF